MDFGTLVRERYSVRTFTDEPVSREVLLEILDDVKQAPTAVNYQPQRFLVMDTPEGMAKLAQCTKYTFKAPCAVLVCYNKNEAWVHPMTGEGQGVVDASICGTYLMLAAHNHGLGTCWVGFFDPQKLREVFNIPDNIVPVALFPMGHPGQNSKPSSMHFSRKNVEDVTIWETF